MPRFTHLIFDLDGTLVDTKADLAAATNHMLHVLGLPTLSVPQVEHYIGDGARVLVERALGAGSASFIEKGLVIFLEYYADHLLDHTRAYAGIVPLLEETRAQGITLSVLTNKPEAPSRTLLSGLGIAKHFALVIGGDTLPVRKPNPQGVMHLQRETGSPLAQTLLIGDSRIDVETGKAAGIATCGVTWGFGAQGFLTTPPDFVVNTAEELRQLVLQKKATGHRL